MDALNARCRLAALHQQLQGDRDHVFELLEELEALEVLREHVPAHRRYLFDRLETTLQRIDSSDEAIADAEADCELEDDDPTSVTF